MNLLRKIAFPFVPLYYLITVIRNWMYDINVFKSKSYDLPIICVGNLSVGGTGKSPMVEYLIRLLKDRKELATLSRGYKRKTKGFIVADTTSTVSEVGDEPLQFFSKFNTITVAVDADRQHGISKLINKGVDAIILDDAFQHRQVKAGLQIVLTTYNQPYFNDILLPTGNLREPRSGAKRADIIVITKCPNNLSETQKQLYINKINPKSYQHVFFSRISYSDFVITESIKKQLSEFKNAALSVVTGIANPKPLLDYLNSNGLAFEHLKYNDHHEFSSQEIELISQKDLIITTEKDYMRLKGEIDSDKLFYLPIEVMIDRVEAFNKVVLDFVETL